MLAFHAVDVYVLCQLEKKCEKEAKKMVVFYKNSAP